MRLLDSKGMKLTYIKAVTRARVVDNGYRSLLGFSRLDRGIMTDKGRTAFGTKIGTKISARFTGVASDTWGRFSAPSVVFARSLVYQSYRLTYGIDLVTFNKKKLGKKRKGLEYTKEQFFDYKVDAIQLINQLCPRNLSGFYGTYTEEVLTFMVFLQHDLAAMNSLDIIDELFKFKTDYYNQKIPVASIPRCNVFIENFIEKLKDPQFIKSLPSGFNRLLMLYKAYAAGIGNFKSEMASLSREGLSVPELSHKIDGINSKFLTSVKTFDDSYFRILIQINRYQFLHRILQNIPKIKLSQFKTQVSVADNNSDIVQTQLSSIVGDLSQLPIDFHQSFYNYAPMLLQLNNESAQKVLKTLVNLFSQGIIDDSFRIKDYLVVHPKFIPTLLHLKSIINCDFDKLSPEQILWVLETQIDRSNDAILIELNDTLTLKFKFDQSTQFLDDLIKVDPKPQQEEYRQIPDNLYLHDYVYQLQLLQEEVMGKPFKNFTKDEIITKLHQVIFSTGNQFFEENSSTFTKLYYKLKTLFAINGGNTEVLDVLINNQDAYNKFEEKIASKKQVDTNTSPLKIQVEPQLIVEEEIIPLQPKRPIEVTVTTANDKGINDSQLSQFIRELVILRDVFLKNPFSKTTCENINDILTKEINNIYSRDSSPHINNDNVLNFIRLHKRLTRMFRENGGNCAILDELIPSSEENIENEVQLEYRQIPESLPVHQFTPELIILQDEMNKKYADVSPGEIDSVIAEKVDNVLNKLNTPSKFSAENVHTFIKLRQVLAKLFVINGGNTEVLDKVIYSTQIFDKIEKSKEAARPYKQLPDDFHLEEYVLELIQLRNEVGGSFTGTSAATVLEKIQSLASTTDSPDKKLIWNKLYRNIAMLFYHNNNNTFVLDSILVNGDHFTKFELKKALQQDKTIGWDDISNIFNNNWFEINKFFERVEWDEISTQDFDWLLYDFSSLPDIDWHVVYNLRLLNSKIESFPEFLVELYCAKKKDNDLHFSGEMVEERYQLFLRCLEDEKNLEPDLQERDGPDVETEIGTVSDPAFLEAETDSAPVVDEVIETKLKNNYNDSERLLALLSKETEPADLEKLTNRLVKDDDSEFSIKDAISIAMNKDHDNSLINDEQYERKLGNQNINNKRTTSASQVDSSEIKTESIETFLKKAKKDKEREREGKSREAEAFEWSRGTLNSNNLIDANTLFGGEQNNKGPNNLFPSSSVIGQGNLEYILLSIDGQAIPANIEQIGQLPKEDIFQILKKFDKEDLDKFKAQFERLQNEHWKVVGSKVETSFDGGDQKYLILSRSKDDFKRKSSGFAKLKTLFAVTGAGFTSMILANIFLDERSDNRVEENERVEVAAAPTIPVVPTIPVGDAPLEEKVQVREARETKSGWFWR